MNRRNLLALCIAAVTFTPSGSARADMTAPPAQALYQRFAVPAKTTWGTVAIDLRAQTWRVGRIDGPAATEAELRAALDGAASLEIGAHCAGWVEVSTVYPCGFAVRDFGVRAGGERFTAIATDLQPADAGAVRATSVPRPDLQAAGLIAPVPDAKRFVAVRVPQRFLQDLGAAYAGKLRFEFRAITNPLVPSEFDRSSAVVVLRDNHRHAQASVPAMLVAPGAR